MHHPPKVPQLTLYITCTVVCESRVRRDLLTNSMINEMIGQDQYGILPMKQTFRDPERTF